MTKTVIQHVLSRLKDIGVKDIFGAAGDFAFPTHDAICSDRGLRFVGSCNELNAAYAADGYARIHGIAAVSTTYGVGELSAINGIAGSYAEHLPPNSIWSSTVKLRKRWGWRSRRGCWCPPIE